MQPEVALGRTRAAAGFEPIVLACAWVLSIVGLIVAYVISLAGAMSTIPQLHWQDALFGIPLPVVAGALAVWCMLRPTHPAEATTRRPWIWASIPLVLAFLTLLLMAVSYVEQPGGPR